MGRVADEPAPDPVVIGDVAEGHAIKGLSTLYDGKGKLVSQWVKTSSDPKRQEAKIRELARGLRAKVTPIHPTPAPETLRDLMAVYPVGDHHLGMYAWSEESGGNYDMKLGSRMLRKAMGSLCAGMPKAERALVALLGDFFHYDTLDPVTPTAKNQLDSDGRYALMIRTGIRLVRDTIELARARHKRVDVIVQAGNHDPTTSLFLAECLSAFYENEPRVTVDTSPRQFHYVDHGECLVGVCHGHEVRRLDDLPLLMARDRPEEWGRTRHRYWLTGHVHKDRVVDVAGVRVESFRILPPTDAWADAHGYRSSQEMKALLLHAKHGEVQRVSVNPGMFA